MQLCDERRVSSWLSGLLLLLWLWGGQQGHATRLYHYAIVRVSPFVRTRPCLPMQTWQKKGSHAERPRELSSNLVLAMMLHACRACPFEDLHG